MKINERIAKLIDVKSLVTFAVIGVFCVLALRGTVDVGNFMTVAVAIITFYFAKKDGGSHDAGN